LKALVSLLEPALILMLGLVVGFVIISLLMAVFQLNTLVR
jgi:general secretion pathway protein F